MIEKYIEAINSVAKQYNCKIIMHIAKDDKISFIIAHDIGIKLNGPLTVANVLIKINSPLEEAIKQTEDKINGLLPLVAEDIHRIADRIPGVQT